MRIAYFLDEFPPFFRGGLGTYALEVAPRLAAAGHALSVYAWLSEGTAAEEIGGAITVRRPAIPDPRPLLPILLPQEVAGWPPDSQRFFAEYQFFSILSAGDLLERGVGHDLAVAHDWLAAPAGMLAAASLNIPFVLHVHSTEVGRSAGGGSPTIRALEARAAERADVVVTVSRAMQDELVSLGVPREKIRVVYNGVDPAKYDPGRVLEADVRAFRERLGLGDDPVILFVGRLTRVKGADTLVRAFQYVLQDIPEARLVVIGVGETEDEVRHLAEMKGGGRVHLLFSVLPEEERIIAYAAADLCVFPSNYEPFGIVCTEAMAMAKPVVVGAQGTSGMREQVVPSGPGICGFHIDPYDPRDIAIYISLILRDAALRKTMGRNGRARVLAMFTWEGAVEATLAAYEEACQGRGG